MALFGVDAERVYATGDAGLFRKVVQTLTDSETDRRMECDEMILVLESAVFYHRKSLTSGSVGIASELTR